MSGRVGRVLAPSALIVAALAIWEVLVRLRDTPAWFLPAPSGILRTLWVDRALLLHHAGITLQAVLAGFALALVAGVLLAAAIDASPTLQRAIYPIVIASQAVPIVALAPLLLVWFGYGLLPKVIVTALVAFFPIVVNTVDGLRSADREALALVRAFGATPWRRFWLIKAPGALPSLFSGARIGISVAVIGAVFGEFVGSKAGLGYLMDLSAARLLTERVFACIVLLAAMAIVLFALVGVAERAAMPWRRFTTETGT